MRKGWKTLLMCALVVTMVDTGVARALECTHSSIVEIRNIESTGDGCNLIEIGQNCLHIAGGYTQITGGGCSSDPALSLLSSQIYDEGNGQLTWQCIYQLPSVDGVCQANNLTFTTTTICCK
jgi:hypothetical protein